MKKIVCKNKKLKLVRIVVDEEVPEARSGSRPSSICHSKPDVRWGYKGWIDINIIPSSIPRANLHNAQGTNYLAKRLLSSFNDKENLEFYV